MFELVLHGHRRTYSTIIQALFDESIDKITQDLLKCVNQLIRIFLSQLIYPIMPPHQITALTSFLESILEADIPSLGAPPIPLHEALVSPQAHQERALYVRYMDQSQAELWPIVPVARDDVLLPEWQHLRKQLVSLEAKATILPSCRRLQLVKWFDMSTAYSLFSECKITPRVVNPAYYFYNDEKYYVEQGLFDNIQALIQLRHTVMRVAIINVTPLLRFALTNKCAWEASRHLLQVFGDYIDEGQSTFSLLGY